MVQIYHLGSARATRLVLDHKDRCKTAKGIARRLDQVGFFILEIKARERTHLD